MSGKPRITLDYGWESEQDYEDGASLLEIKGIALYIPSELDPKDIDDDFLELMETTIKDAVAKAIVESVLLGG